MGVALGGDKKDKKDRKKDKKEKEDKDEARADKGKKKDKGSKGSESSQRASARIVEDGSRPRSAQPPGRCQACAGEPPWIQESASEPEWRVQPRRASGRKTRREKVPVRRTSEESSRDVEELGDEGNFGPDAQLPSERRGHRRTTQRSGPGSTPVLSVHPHPQGWRTHDEGALHAECVRGRTTTCEAMPCPRHHDPKDEGSREHPIRGALEVAQRIEILGQDGEGVGSTHAGSERGSEGRYSEQKTRMLAGQPEGKANKGGTKGKGSWDRGYGAKGKNKGDKGGGKSDGSKKKEEGAPKGA